eukprot:TRINITY_DN9923_c0_g1_i1.p1 TRINITY_DN9923_c0_g1~~TRINITY_DN9923_c0_g1_i1.p1  ORF type:complete len:146 (+),score=6.52 TRINITY_DN9923_c0_g1_i1:128-565(+)
MTWKTSMMAFPFTRGPAFFTDRVHSFFGIFSRLSNRAFCVRGSNALVHNIDENWITEDKSGLGKGRSLPLVREYISDVLYHPSQGYFAASASPVGRLHSPFDFSSFSGRKDYEEAVSRVYDLGKFSWLTPIQLFKVGGCFACWFM